ncbi:MAG: hypothetical protein WCR79_03225 [Fusobacterium sp.]
MFNKEYVFKGKHAKYVKKLTDIYNEEYKLKVFNTNIEVYLLSSIVGVLYRNNAAVDLSDNFTSKIFPETIISYSEDIKYNYRIVLLLDNKYEPSKDKRIDKAFRYMDTEKGEKDYELYDGYVRGGIEILYNRIIQNAHNEEEYLDNLIEFLDDFQKEYGKALSDDKTENSIFQMIKAENNKWRL